MPDDSKKLILIVEDEEDIRTYLETFFEDNGYSICTASDGHEGFELLQKKRPDLVTLDLQMPNETGTKFYRRMQKDDELKNIPVIVISGLAGRHLALGNPVAVFEKPIDRDQVLKAVQEVLG